MDLKQLRDGIDAIDSDILSLFMKRMELCRGVADYKKAHDLPVFQGGREQEVLDRIKKLTNDKELENVLKGRIKDKIPVTENSFCSRF